jgi:hypothetical protein
MACTERSSTGKHYGGSPVRLQYWNGRRQGLDSSIFGNGRHDMNISIESVRCRGFKKMQRRDIILPAVAGS